MANAQVLRNAVVQIQTALGSAKTITGITKASPAVVTATHDYSVGDYVVITSVGGMTQVNDRVFRVSAVSTTVSFTLESIDSSGYTTYTSGGTAKKITFGASFDNITQLDIPDATPDEIDVTSIHDDERQIEFGHAAAQKGSFSCIADPLATAVVEVGTADRAQERRAFLVTLASGYKCLFNAYCSGGTGFSGGVGAAGTGQISLSLRTKAQWFSS